MTEKNLKKEREKESNGLLTILGVAYVHYDSNLFRDMNCVENSSERKVINLRGFEDFGGFLNNGRRQVIVS